MRKREREKERIFLRSPFFAVGVVNKLLEQECKTSCLAVRLSTNEIFSRREFIDK